MKSNKILGVSLILLGLLFITKVLGIWELQDSIIYGSSLILYGLLTVYNNLEGAYRGKIFMGTTLFLSGIMMLLLDYYTIIEKDHLFMTVFLFISGAGFVMLFLDNYHEKVFLLLGGLLVLCSVFTKEIVSLLGKFSLLANIGLILMGYWPVFLILFGAAILISRTK